MSYCENLAADVSAVLATDLAQAMQTYADALTVSGVILFAVGMLAGILLTGAMHRETDKADA